MMANRSDRGRGQPAECPGHQSPQSRMGPRPRKPSGPAVFDRANRPDTRRHPTSTPDRHRPPCNAASTPNRHRPPCNAGAIHTRHAAIGQLRTLKLPQSRPRKGQKRTRRYGLHDLDLSHSSYRSRSTRSGRSGGRGWRPRTSPTRSCRCWPKVRATPCIWGEGRAMRGTAIPMHGVKRYALDGGSFHVIRSDAEFWHPT
ncbi:MAG: hypothetical protein K0S06_4125 [Microvirga sp.]|nr:hypothetical protein [Microvirga sp.]